MQYLRTLVVLIAAVAWTTPSDATVIDSFNNGWGLGGSVGLGEGTTNDNAGPFEDILGGTRKASVKFTGSGDTANVRFTVNQPAAGSAGFFFFFRRSGPTATGAVKMVLDGNNVMTGLTVDGTGGIDFNGLGAVDLTEGGIQTAFEFVTGSMSRTHSVTLTLYDSSADDGTSTSHTFTLAGSTIQTVGFSHFDSGILTDVGAVALRVDLLDDEARFELDNWQVVPEPSTLVLAAIGLLGLAFYGWRRRRHRTLRAVGAFLALVLCVCGAQAGTIYIGPYNEDSDGDGVPDLNDNSPWTHNPLQLDDDDDCWGNASDPYPYYVDGDGDGVADPFDPRPSIAVSPDPVQFNVNGPYTIIPGNGLTLSFSLEPTPVQTPFFISLDTDDNGSMEGWWVGQVSENTIDLTWAQLQALGLGSGDHLLGATASRGGLIYGWSDHDMTSTGVVPEPSTFVLAAIGLLGLAFCGWRRKR